jgi:RNA polymerase sigma factor (sigma-70 family)
MPETNDFHDLICRVRAGNEEAATEIVQRYEPAIRRAVRIRLVDSRLRRLFDSMDISQSVFASFFVRATLGQYELDNPAHLMRLLVAMSRKKLADHAREQTAARRDYRRSQASSQRDRSLAGSAADPSQQVAAKELVQEFRRRLSAEELQLADLRVGGHTWEQIATEQGESSEALRKKLARAVDRISRDLGLEEFDNE